MNKPKIFISYCHEDMDQDLLRLLVTDLEKNKKIEVMCDINVDPGSSIDEFISKIEQCQVVIILGTPEYKKRILNRKNILYDEYKIVLRTHENFRELEEIYGNNEIHNNNDSKDILSELAAINMVKRFNVIPVLLSGLIDDSIPEDFRRFSIVDFKNIQVMSWKKGEDHRVQHNYRNKYDKFIKLISEIASNAYQDVQRENQKNKKEEANKIFRRIFFELKHDSINIDRNTIRKLFVKTNEFKKVLTQSAYILIGRKGSGKSTLADFLTYGVAKKWKPPHLLNVNEFSLNLLYTMTTPSQKSDYKHIFSMIKLMNFAWQATFIYLCYESLRIEDSKGLLSSDQASRFLSLDGEHKKLSFFELVTVGEKSEIALKPDAFFGYALQRALDFTENLIKNAPTENGAFTHYLIAQFSESIFFEYLFSKAFMREMNEISKFCRRRFMITLDGFDSNFQQFRLETLRIKQDNTEYLDRIRFEQAWLNGLIDAVRKLKRSKLEDAGSKIDFCITIPKDRFMEFLDSDRDAIEWTNKQLDINWTGIELAILLRKRLEVVRGIETEKCKTPLDRLQDVFKASFSEIPRNISITLDRRIVEIPIFQYVLRHTFWRPRDVLFIWGRIIAFYEESKSKKISFSEEAVKMIVVKAIGEIIKFEFFGEFRESIRNLENIIMLFKHKSQVMKLKEFYEIIQDRKMEIDLTGYFPSVERGNIPNQITILKILFNIGFIGIYCSDKGSICNRYETPWIFYFNEGDSVVQLILSEDSDKVNIIIHPIFNEFLSLDVFREVLVADFPDSYLIKQEINRIAI